MRWVKALIEEFAPIAALGICNSLYGFQMAVLAMLLTMFIVLCIVMIVEKRAPWFAVMSSVSVGLFASASYIAGDFDLFALSDTLIDGVLGVSLLFSLTWQKPLLQRFFGETFAISDEAWRILSIRWGIFLVALALANELVRQSYSNDTWTTFKLYATAGIVVFGCLQLRLSHRHRIEGEANTLGLRRA